MTKRKFLPKTKWKSIKVQENQSIQIRWFEDEIDISRDRAISVIIWRLKKYTKENICNPIDDLWFFTMNLCHVNSTVDIEFQLIFEKFLKLNLLIFPFNFSSLFRNRYTKISRSLHNVLYLTRSFNKRLGFCSKSIKRTATNRDVSIWKKQKK